MLWAICLGCIYSCSPLLYQPNRINVPELQKKGDLRVSASFSLTGDDVQASYAVKHNVGVLANYYTYTERDWYDNYLLGGASCLEAGAGHFSTHGHLIFENYATIGAGSMYMRGRRQYSYHTSSDDFDTDFLRLGLQSSLTYRRGLFSLSAMCRFNRMNYYNISGEAYYNQSTITQYLSNDNVHHFIEPAVQLTIGFKNFKYITQYQRSFHVGNTSWFPYFGYHYSAGLQLSLNTAKKKRVKNG